MPLLRRTKPRGGVLARPDAQPLTPEAVVRTTDALQAAMDDFTRESEAMAAGREQELRVALEESRKQSDVLRDQNTVLSERLATMEEERSSLSLEVDSLKSHIGEVEH